MRPSWKEPLRPAVAFFPVIPLRRQPRLPRLMAERLPPLNGVFLQMEDEIASVCAAIGAAFGGMLACTASSGPGISLMQEGVGYAAETEAPIVVINVMRGGPSTGMPTAASQQDIMQAKWGSHGDYETIALMPSSCQEAFSLTYRAFVLAQKYRVPVYVLSDEIIGHTREKVRIPRGLPPVKRQPPQGEKEDYQPFKAGPDGLLDGMPAFNEGYKLLVDGQLHDERGRRAAHIPEVCARLTERLCQKITIHREEIYEFETAFLDDADIVVVCFGSPSRPALRAVKDARLKGIRAGYFKILSIWPFPIERIRALPDRIHTLIVPELNVGRVIHEVEHATAGQKRSCFPSQAGRPAPHPGEILEAIVKRNR